MAYDLAVQCLHQTSILSVYPEMSMEDIMELIRSRFDITTDSFELQIYDDRFGKYIDFDDEYAEELRQILPRTIRKTLSAQVLLQVAEKIETGSTFNCALSPSYMPGNSPSGASASDDLRSTTPDTDRNLCFYGNFSSSSSSMQLNHDEDFNAISHLTFVRDVASYQRSQYQLNDYHQNVQHPYCQKKKYTIRIQGVKKDSDKKYASVLPKVKFPLHLLRQNQFTLVIAAVIEERNEEQVNWRLDTRRGFLRDDVETDMIHYNPFCLNVDRSELTSDGIFELSLRMCTISQNQTVKAGPVFYTLPLNAAQKLHKADYEPNTLRLACVMNNQNNIIQWDTFGLSDFIRPKIYAKRKVENLNPATPNDEHRTKKQLKISEACTSASVMHTGEATSNSSRKQTPLMKEFKIALFGSNWNEMNNSISEIYQIHNHVAIFDKIDSFIDFLTHAQDQQVVLILFNCLDETLISSIHDISQLHSIYIVGSHEDKNVQWTKMWDKITGIYSDMKITCRALKQIILNSGSNCILKSITYRQSNTNLGVNHVSFMYEQIFKETLHQISYNEQSKQDFIDLCRRQFVDQNTISVLFDKFERDYDRSSPIWWYTKESYLYAMLNQALRQQDIDTLTKIRYYMPNIHHRYNRLQFVTASNNTHQIDEDIMKVTIGFSDRFLPKTKKRQNTPDQLHIEAVSLNNLYQQIERLHLNTDETIRTTLYRGQGISSCEFEKLKQNRGGLLSFNNFLSTSTDRNVSFMFADSAQSIPDLVGILFKISINMAVLSKTFTSSNNANCFGISENEVLFSPNSVFHIQEVKCVDDRLWQVNLTSSHDYNKKPRVIQTKRRQKIANGSTRLRCLFSLMINMGEFEKAEKIHKTLSKTELQDSWEELAYLYCQLGCIKNSDKEFNSALAYYQRALEIRNENLSFDRLELTRLFNNISMVHKSIGNQSEGISYLRQALYIQQTSLQIIPSDLIITYNNIGQLYSFKGEYTTSLLYFQKAIEILENFHVSPYPFLSSIYLNIGKVYYSIGDGSIAFTFFQKALEIQQQKTSFIPAELAEIYNIIRTMHNVMRKCMTSLVNYQKALQIYDIYVPLLNNGIGNKPRSTAGQIEKNNEIESPLKVQTRPKTDSKRFIATTPKVEWLDSYENAYRISDEDCEHMKLFFFRDPLEKLLDGVITGYIDKMKFVNNESREKIKEYMKMVTDSEQLGGLAGDYTSSETGFCSKLNYDLAEIGSNFCCLSTQNLFNPGYLDNEASKGLDQHIFATILTNHSLYQPYRYTGTVYSGIRITEDELAKYKTGNIVMAISFISTSQDKNMVKRFLSVNDVEKEPVMCVYQVKNHRSSLCIKDLSEFPMEEDVLIVPFTIFRVAKEADVDMSAGDKNHPIGVISLEEWDLNPS